MSVVDPHFIKRHGGWFRPEAEDYTRTLADAGVFSGEVARRYLGVDGLTIHSAASVRADVEAEIARTRQALARLESLLAGLPSSAPAAPRDPSPAPVGERR